MQLFIVSISFYFSLQDIAAKVLSFSQQRPRALCIMSGTGTISSVTLCKPGSTDRHLTYEVSKSFIQLIEKEKPEKISYLILFLCFLGTF